MDRPEALIQARSDYVKLLEQSLEQIVQALSSLEGVERISLFGSYARGRADLFTDLDILVVMDTNLGFLERLRLLYSLVAVPVDLDIFCYTPKELQALKERPFFRHILQGGRVLYERGRA